MKNKLKLIAICHLLFAICLSVFAQGTAFTYQGQLQNNGSPASGTYNLTFSLFDTNTSGVAIAGPVTNNAVIVTNGLFTVLIDFGPGVFTGADQLAGDWRGDQRRQSLHHVGAAPAIDADAVCNLRGECQRRRNQRHDSTRQPGRHLWRCGDVEQCGQ